MSRDLASLVKQMRELGVTEFDGIKLGPEPGSIRVRPREERKEPEGPRESAEERAHRIMFAATSVRPPLPKKTRRSDVPRAVEQRREAEAAAHGEAEEAREARTPRAGKRAQ